MFNIKTKKITLTLCLGMFVAALLSPALTQAEVGDSGNKAANQAAEQRAAIAKRKERIKKEKEAEAAKQAGETQQVQPAETQQPAEDNEEAPAAQE